MSERDDITQLLNAKTSVLAEPERGIDDGAALLWLVKGVEVLLRLELARLEARERKQAQMPLSKYGFQI